MKPTVTIKLNSIQIDNPDDSLLNAIAEKISKTDLNNDGDGCFEGEFDFEQKTSNEDLMLHVQGKLSEYGHDEPETNSFVVKSVIAEVSIEANLNGDKVDFDVNKYNDFEETVVIAVKKLIK